MHGGAGTRASGKRLSTEAPAMGTALSLLVTVLATRAADAAFMADGQSGRSVSMFKKETTN